MRVGVIGGGLQGVEAAYLAGKAGWEVVLVDRRPAAPAAGLADRFVQHEVSMTAGLAAVLDGVDVVLPALEDSAALEILAAWTRKSGVPFAFDAEAYAVSSSKSVSNRLFEQLQLPVPRLWPDCAPPLIAKPVAASGSRGVRLVEDGEQLQRCFAGDRPPDDWLLQEFVPGPVCSLEVIGFEGRYQPLQVTDLALDASFDCKRVLAPTLLPSELVAELERMAVAVAENIQLNGIMDIEVVDCGGTLKVLEIDARLPSQTPMAVFAAGGLNMVEALAELYTGRRDAVPSQPCSRGALLEHVRVSANLLEVAGEHIMAARGPLCLVRDFFGANEAITDFGAGRQDWAATLLIKAPDRPAAWRKRNRVIERIMTGCGVSQYLDFAPALMPVKEASSNGFRR